MANVNANYECEKTLVDVAVYWHIRIYKLDLIDDQHVDIFETNWFHSLMDLRYMKNLKHVGNDYVRHACLQALSQANLV